MFPVRRCVAPSWFQNQPHAKRAWKPSKTLLKMRESCTFSNQIFHVVLVFFFPCHSSFRINTTDCPCHMVDAHISTRNFLIQQLLVQRFKKKAKTMKSCAETKSSKQDHSQSWNIATPSSLLRTLEFCLDCDNKMSMYVNVTIYSSCLFQRGKPYKRENVENFSPRNCWIFRHHKTHRNLQCRCHKLLIHCPDSAQIQRLVPCIQDSHHAPNAFQVALKNVFQIRTSRSAFLQ